jgi:hypothetical protein
VGLATTSVDLVDDGRAPGGVTAVREDEEAIRGELARHLPADPAGGAGD